jgi:SAM-dependent methyltransferase
MAERQADMDRPKHWESIYRSRGERERSWFEEVPAVSLELMQAAGLSPGTCVVDVGGGESRLVDELLARGLHCLAVLDVSHEALVHTRARLGETAQTVRWIEADVTGAWSLEPMDIWHDRAVFHFLVAADDRRRYVSRLRETLKLHGSAIIATFAPDGPERCSGLPVVRYSPAMLADQLGDGFRLDESRLHQHATPAGPIQSFQYSRFQRVS